jgi:hypothetical protein
MNLMNDRHLLDRVRGSRGARVTTLVPPDMVATVEEDLEAIRLGDGRKLPDNQFEYRGRIYAWEKGETYYPVSGPGFLVADRAPYKALQTFSRHGGVTDVAMQELTRDPFMPKESVESAIEMWRKRTNRGNDDVLD